MRLGGLVGCLALALVALPLQGASVADLAWLAGCWQPEGSESGSTEQWTAAAGGTMLGVSRTVKGGETVAYEFLQIRERAGGGLEYVAHPSGQRETPFALLRLEARAVVFENLEHDFPQRIVYRLEAEDRLHTHIEGEVQGEVKTILFPMRRVRCGS